MKTAGITRTFLTVATLLLGGSLTAFAGVVFSDNFEAGTLANGNWGHTGSAAVVGNPSVDVNNPSASVVSFAGFGSGGDLFSVFFPEGVTYGMSLDFDVYPLIGATGWVGTDHQNSAPCGSPCDEQWLWNNQGGALYGTVAPAGQWTHVSFAFQPFDSNTIGVPGEIVLKLEQQGNAVYFDNISVQVLTPEPGTAGVLGLGLLSLEYLRRRRRSRM